ncbi:aminopeptidase P family protein [Pseudomonas entomophila]|uniref:aminopeptidase P family protein n=1 Tax=Pseudomonas entomophila TaxID=312306 RepID=UPI0015E46718|nr:aminopeptidase P family protein [Pseudomonas entomophila]MBA1187770.1 aminopeptidase P family protein [Pseudomonas entomophila]
MNTEAVTSSVIPARLARVRELMSQRGVQALLVPSADPHLSEYLPEYWQARRWLSGFTGSVGMLVVTHTFAGVWVDSRYWEQAQSELLGTGVTLMKWTSGQPDALDWLVAHAEPGQVVAVDGRALSLALARQLRYRLAQRQASLMTHHDLFDKAWCERPALPDAMIVEHLPPEACTTRQEKLSSLRQAMQAHRADWHFLATLDDIAWLFNLRGSDVPYNPVFLSFALIGHTQAVLFVAPGKLDPIVRQRLNDDGVTLQDYDQAAQALTMLPAGSHLLFDPAKVTCAWLDGLDNAVQQVEALNPTTLAKACKTEAERLQIRQAMEQDGAALCEFFAWFEAQVGRGGVTELDVDAQLLAARRKRPGFVSPSFATIAGFNANGAMPHYRATERAHAVIEGDGLLLIDSGAQYKGGTTDITRMVPIGRPSEAQKLDCTRVLQGVIALSRAVFPRGILSPALDAIARAPLWADQVEYGHGTGHGVGYFLNVHEGPQVIAYQARAAAHMAMLPGMVTSIEPGTYRPGEWGVRIENLVINREAGESAFGQFLRFETLTLCPIDTRCLMIERLDAAQRQWLNDYHAQVRERLLPWVEGAARQWLETRTQAV